MTLEQICFDFICIHDHLVIELYVQYIVGRKVKLWYNVFSIGFQMNPIAFMWNYSGLKANILKLNTIGCQETVDHVGVAYLVGGVQGTRQSVPTVSWHSIVIIISIYNIEYVVNYILEMPT